MLKLLFDEFNLLNDHTTILTSQVDLARSWDEILAGILTEESKSFILRLRTLEPYFRNLKRKFGNKLEIRTLLPSVEWKRTMGFAMPSEIDEKHIADLLSNHTNTLQNKSNRKLGTLCNLLGITDFSDFESEYFIEECILKNAEKRLPELTNQVITEMLVSLPAGKKEFWQRLKEEKSKKEFLIGTLKSQIVKSYPNVSLPYTEFYKQNLEYPHISFSSRLSIYLDSEFYTKIETCLRSLEPDQLYSAISGKLQDEWTLVIECLNKHPVQSQAVILSLLERATEFPNIYEEIRKFEPVLPPQNDINVTNINTWIDQYFNFYLYSRRIGRNDATEGFLSSFEDFILKHFLDLDDYFTKNSILVLRNEVERHLRAKKKVLMLVVDGLSYCYYGELQRIFGVTGSFLFSTLPTITAINKRRILSGLLDLDDNYDSIISKLYGEFRWRTTDSDQQNLENFLLEEEDLYIYWENQFDAYIHRSMSFTKRYYDHIEILNNLAKCVHNFIEIGGVVLLTGDHGYTTLPHKEANKIVLNEDISEITHGRVYHLNEGAQANLPSDCVIFVEDSLAIARGYHYFSNLPKGATHGGATPEELIVPFLTIEKKREDLDLLSFKLPDEEEYRRGRKQVVQVIIINPNIEDVEVSAISFIPQVLKLLSPVPVILVNGDNRLSAEFDLTMVRTEECKIFVEYKVGKKSYQCNFSIHTKGAMTETADDWE